MTDKKEEVEPSTAADELLEVWPGSKLRRVATLLCRLSADILSGDCCRSCFILRYLARGDLTGLMAAFFEGLCEVHNDVCS